MQAVAQYKSRRNQNPALDEQFVAQEVFPTSNSQNIGMTQMHRNYNIGSFAQYDGNGVQSLQSSAPFDQISNMQPLYDHVFGTTDYKSSAYAAYNYDSCEYETTNK
jgi:hypothetical protein